MDYYYKEFDKLQKEFHEVMHDYPLFKENIEKIEKREIKEINDLLEKNDEFYLKKAISILKDLISYVKNTSESIQKEYSMFDKSVKIWEKIELPILADDELNNINSKIKDAYSLINSHDLKDLKRANKIMDDLIKMTR